MKKRLDQHVVDLGLAPSKTKAQELIESGAIEIFDGENRRVSKKSSQAVDEKTAARLISSEVLQYVSRGGRKLKGALEFLKLDVKGLRALDVGISTGGFTDALLQAGAAHVTGVDVARDELDPRLRDDARVEFFGGVNARELKICGAVFGRVFDAIVVDVSFISLEKILPQIYDFLRPQAFVLALIKPQFEVGKGFLNKKGIVTSAAKIEEVLKKIEACAAGCRLKVEKIFTSELKGRDGNQEFFLYATRE